MGYAQTIGWGRGKGEGAFKMGLSARSTRRVARASFQNGLCPAASHRYYIPVNCRGTILPLELLGAWRARLRNAGQLLVVTNGCFDVLHAGHIAYLENARAHGDALLVGLNGDASVQALKGPGRPINSEADRALIL